MARTHGRRWMVLILVGCLSTLALASRAHAGDPRVHRTFLFTYSGRITGMPAGQRVRLWLPTPHDDENQKISVISQDLPATPASNADARGNHMLYLEAASRPDGTLPFSITYRVTRWQAGETPAQPHERDADYLAADALVPIGGKPTQVLLGGKTLPTDPMQAGRTLYDTVDDFMQYRKDKPGYGRGDADWACDSRFGNCTDFHSLFISLARTQKIPAKFEIGFGIPKQHGQGAVAGYHCWAFFKPTGHAWVPVDISEANKDPSQRDFFFGHLCENRVAFSTGRDLTLSPRQDGPALNYFVYPYAEADHKPIPAERISRAFTYEDVAEDSAR